MTRTEEQILSKAPFEVTLGEKQYQVKILGIKAQREWRASLNAELTPLIESFRRDATNATMVAGLTGALLDFPEKIEKLFFSYASNLPKEEIMENATEEQLARAFSSVMTIAFPFLGQLGMVTKLVRTQNQ